MNIPTLIEVGHKLPKFVEEDGEVFIIIGGEKYCRTISYFSFQVTMVGHSDPFPKLLKRSALLAMMEMLSSCSPSEYVFKTLSLHLLSKLQTTPFFLVGKNPPSKKVSTEWRSYSLMPMFKEGTFPASPREIRNSFSYLDPLVGIGTTSYTMRCAFSPISLRNIPFLAELDFELLSPWKKGEWGGETTELIWKLKRPATNFSLNLYLPGLGFKLTIADSRESLDPSKTTIWVDEETPEKAKPEHKPEHRLDHSEVKRRNPLVRYLKRK